MGGIPHSETHSPAPVADAAWRGKTLRSARGTQGRENQAGWAKRHPDQAMLLLFADPHECTAVDEIIDLPR